MLLLLQTNTDSGTFLCCAAPIVIIIFIVIVVVVQANAQHAQKIKQTERIADLAALAHISVGNHLVGFPNINKLSPLTECAVTDADFLFLDVGGREIGKISRDSIAQIIVDDRSQITQRITATRILALGVFALAAPKTQKHKTFCLAIEWVDSKGMTENAIFEFAGEKSNDAANSAAHLLRQYMTLSSQKPRPLERKCPFCAEIIKREAKICRFCRSELGTAPDQIVGNEIDQPDVNSAFDIVLSSSGSNRITVIKRMRELKGFDLPQAVNFVDSAPNTISYGVSRAEAEEIKRILVAEGATVEII
jgi:ribosomal protein L7/L12